MALFDPHWISMSKPPDLTSAIKWLVYGRNDVYASMLILIKLLLSAHGHVTTPHRQAAKAFAKLTWANTGSSLAGFAP